MRLKFGLIVFLIVCLVVGSSALAEEFKKKCIGNWNVAANWVEGTIPSGTLETKIRYDGTVCTLNSVENWTSTSSTKMRVYNYAVLNIVAGGSLTGPSWFRVGYGDPGTVNQSGGALILKEGLSDTSKLVIGFNGGSNGLYYMTGGTITYVDGDGQLAIGDGDSGGGTGKFIVKGTAPEIRMKSLYVGGMTSSRPSTGTLQYDVNASGVSPIHCISYVKLDLGGANSHANLLVNFLAIPTDLLAPIVLVDNQGSGAVTGLFDSFNGGSAEEGKCVSMSGYVYSLTYQYDVATGTCGTGNDIALIPVPSDTSLTISTSTLTINAGDLLIAAVATDGDTSGSIVPVGSDWTAINVGAYSSAVTLGAWWKIAGASETAPDFTGRGGQQTYGWMMRFTGHNAANPINGTPAFYGESSSTPTSPAVTTTVDNCLILRLGAFDGNDVNGLPEPGNPGLSGHTSITMDSSGGSAGGAVSGGAGCVRQSSAGSSDTSTFTLGSSKSARTLTIAIAPADANLNNCCGDLRP
jgi:hypothetical protein